MAKRSLSSTSKPLEGGRDTRRAAVYYARRSQITEQLREVERIVADMRRDQIEIDQLKAETRDLLAQLRTA